MSTFTARATGTLVWAASKSKLSKSDLATLLQRSGWEVPETIGELDYMNVQDLVRGPLDAARRKIARGDTREHAAIIDFTRRFVEAMLPCYRAQVIGELQAAFSSCGYELEVQVKSAFDETVTCQLLPIESGAAPLEPEITALEVELLRRGYTTAQMRYRDAVDNLVDLKFNDANSAIRTTLESLVTELASDHISTYVKPPQASTGGDAIARLIDWNTSKRGPSAPGAPMPKDEGGELLHGIWTILHTNGSHPGISDAQEARLRLQLVTGLAHFLLRHFPKE